MHRDVELSTHAKDMLREREIPEWLWRTIDTPDYTEVGADNNVHYIKSISDDGRFLRVVVNPYTEPDRVVTVFFDRRLGRQR